MLQHPLQQSWPPHLKDDIAKPTSAFLNECVILFSFWLYLYSVSLETALDFESNFFATLEAILDWLWTIKAVSKGVALWSLLLYYLVSFASTIYSSMSNLENLLRTLLIAFFSPSLGLYTPSQNSRYQWQYIRQPSFPHQNFQASRSSKHLKKCIHINEAIHFQNYLLATYELLYTIRA